MNVRLLGSGTSTGVPRIGNDWGRCDPSEPRNRRTRASILVWTDTTRILVDTSPDMREQLLAAQVSDLDAVIWTHDHADHCHGIDDLRQLFHARGRPVRGLARPTTLQSLQTRFGYAFGGYGGYPPMVRGEELPDAIRIGDIDVAVVDQPHGRITSAGLQFSHGGKTITYSTDFNILTDDMAKLYQASDIWICDSLRREPHPSHPTLPQVLGWASALQVKRTVLMHLDQTMDYQTLLAELPAGVEPGFDGWEGMP